LEATEAGPMGLEARRGERTPYQRYAPRSRADAGTSFHKQYESPGALPISGVTPCAHRRLGQLRSPKIRGCVREA